MGKLIGGMGIAHTPSMGHAFDGRDGVGDRSLWQQWFDGLEPVKSWIADKAPTHAIVVYNDHLNYFDLQSYPTFAIGMSDTFPQCDEGWGKRPFPDMSGDRSFSEKVATNLVTDGFDLTFCQELEIDHGIYSWLPCVMSPPWPMAFLPIAVNMTMHPVPRAQRLRDLGAAIGRAIEATADDARVLVIGTGGMSHQIHGRRFGMTNQSFDNYFLSKIGNDVETLNAIPTREIMHLAGTEASELTMWYAMRSALPEVVREVYKFYVRPQITGCGVIVLEPE